MKTASKSVGFLFGLTAILAAGTAAAFPWSNFVTLTGVDVESTPAGLTVWLGTTQVPSHMPCANQSEYELSGNSDAVKAMTTTATAAYLAGKPVKLLFNGTCDGQYANVVGIATF